QRHLRWGRTAGQLPGEDWVRLGRETQATARGGGLLGADEGVSGPRAMAISSAGDGGFGRLRDSAQAVVIARSGGLGGARRWGLVHLRRSSARPQHSGEVLGAAS